MTPVTAAKNRPDFDPHHFLGTIGEGRKFVLFPKKQTIFVQGDLADAVFYIQTGKVKLSVVSKTGKEARGRCTHAFSSDLVRSRSTPKR